MPIAGTWTLEITDDRPGGNHGTLNSWSLIVESVIPLGSTAYESSVVPVAINAGPHLSTIDIVDPGTITDVDVQLNITHEYDGDLDVFLIAPDGTRVELFTDVGGGGDNFIDTILDDDPINIAGGVGSLIGTSLSPIDPLLGPLADNGGPTETHALLLGSPAIDAGDPAFTPPPDFDQRGAPFERVVDGDNTGGATIDMGAFELANDAFPIEIEMGLVIQPTTTGELGEVASLPVGAEWIDEWQTHWMEIWIGSPIPDSAEIDTATVEVDYFPEYFAAMAVVAGPSFAGAITSTIDDTEGFIEILLGTGSGGAVVDSHHVLLARVLFEPTENGAGAPLDVSEPEPISSVDGSWMSFRHNENTRIELTGGVAAHVTLGSPPDTELWPVMYDLDDSGQVGFGDLAIFVSHFLSDVSESPQATKSDFDLSGRVDFGDLVYLTANFLKSRAAADSLVYPSNFPDDFRPDPSGGSGSGGSGSSGGGFGGSGSGGGEITFGNFVPFPGTLTVDPVNISVPRQSAVSTEPSGELQQLVKGEIGRKTWTQHILRQKP